MAEQIIAAAMSSAATLALIGCALLNMYGGRSDQPRAEDVGCVVLPLAVLPLVVLGLLYLGSVFY